MSKVVLAKKAPNPYDSYPTELKDIVDSLIQNGLPVEYKNKFVQGTKLTLFDFPKDFFVDKKYKDAVITLSDNLEALNKYVVLNKKILDYIGTYNPAGLEEAKVILKEKEKEESYIRKDKKMNIAIEGATAPLKKELEEKNEEIARLQARVDEITEYFKKASAEEKEAILKETEEQIALAKDEASRKVFEDAKKAMLLMRDTYEKELDETKKLIPPRVLSNQEKQALYKSFGPVIDKAAREHIPDDNLPYYFEDRGIKNPELQKSLAQAVRQREAGMLSNRMINERILNRPELLDTLTAPMRDQYFENVPQFRQPRPQDLPLPIQNENWEERAPIPKRWLTRRMYWQVKNM